MKTLIFLVALLIPLNAQAITRTITIPNEKAQAIGTAFVTVHGKRLQYNPAEENELRFFKRVIIDFINQTGKASINEDVEAYRLQKIQEVQDATGGVTIE